MPSPQDESSAIHLPLDVTLALYSRSALYKLYLCDHQLKAIQETDDYCRPVTIAQSERLREVLYLCESCAKLSTCRVIFAGEVRLVASVDEHGSS